MKLIRTIKMSQTLATCNTPWAMLKGVPPRRYVGKAKLTSRQLVKFVGGLQLRHMVLGTHGFVLLFLEALCRSYQESHQAPGCPLFASIKRRRISLPPANTTTIFSRIIVWAAKLEVMALYTRAYYMSHPTALTMLVRLKGQYERHPQRKFPV